MLTLIEGGSLFVPAPLGPGSLLLGGGVILAAGEIDGAGATPAGARVGCGASALPRPRR
jgi:hypothetical protein